MRLQNDKNSKIKAKKICGIAIAATIAIVALIGCENLNYSQAASFNANVDASDTLNAIDNAFSLFDCSGVKVFVDTSYTSDEEKLINPAFSFIINKIPNVMESFIANEGHVYYCRTDGFAEMLSNIGDASSIRFGMYYSTDFIVPTVWILDESLAKNEFSRERDIETFHNQVIFHEFMHYWDYVNKFSSSLECIALFKKYTQPRERFYNEDIFHFECISNEQAFVFYNQFILAKDVALTNNYAKYDELRRLIANDLTVDRYLSKSASTYNYIATNEKEFFACLMTDYTFYQEYAAEQMPKDLYNYFSKITKTL